MRQITVPTLDERALGALFMQYMLETILMGKLMGVDPSISRQSRKAKCWRANISRANSPKGLQR